MSNYLLSNDPTAMIHRHLKRALPDRNGLEWVHLHSLPKGWNPNEGLMVVVSDDVQTTNNTSHDRTLVRITVHSGTRDAARRLARSIHQFLLSPMGGFGLGIDRQRSTGVLVGPDSLAGGYVATTSISCGTAKLPF